MRYMNCFEAVLGLLSCPFTADIKSDGAVIAGVVPSSCEPSCSRATQLGAGKLHNSNGAVQRR